MQCYAAYSKHEKERLASSSGGIFSLLAKTILNGNGVVYGVAFDKTFKAARFIRVKDENELGLLRGSKYFQAFIGDAFKQVRRDLEEGRRVLFSGTACQINGLKNFLAKDYAGLICVDIVCHGVPSQKLWSQYAADMEKRNGANIENVNFRSKKRGWTHFGINERFNGKDLFIARNEDAFMQMFLKNYSLRPSCYHCVVKKNKLADMTIGDFWGIDDIAPEMNDEKGISLVILRSEKGTGLFESVLDDVVCKPVSYEDGVKFNYAEFDSVQKPSCRDTFYTDLNKLTFTQLKKKYTTRKWKLLGSRVKRFIKKIKNKLHKRS